MAMLPPPMEYTALMSGLRSKAARHETLHGLVEAVAVVDLDHGAVRIAVSHRALEPHLSFFLAAEEPSTQSDQHVSRPVTQPLAHQIRGGRTRSPVVHSDVGQPLAAGEGRVTRVTIGIPAWISRQQAVMISGTSGRLQDHSV